MQPGSHVIAARELVTDIERVFLFPLMLLLSALALLLFVWGVFQYIVNAGDVSARSKGRQHMIYGIIGLAVMAGAYTILQIAAMSFGCDISSGICS